jgi:hypothetical protein
MIVPGSATDAKYADKLGSFLARRQIRSAISNYIGTDPTTPGSTTSTTVCVHSPRYLYYRVNEQQYPRLLGTTKILYDMTAHLVDCNNPALPLSVGDQSSFGVATTKAPLASVLTIFSKTFLHAVSDWANVIAVGALVSGFVDETPGADVVERHVYDVGLADLVNSLCKRIDAATSSPINTVSGKTLGGNNVTLQTRVAGGFQFRDVASITPPGGTTQQASTSQSDSNTASNGNAAPGLPVFDVLATQPPPLHCGDANSPTPAH